MKQVLILFILFANGAFAQTSFKDIIKDCDFGFVETEKMENIRYTNSHGEEVSCTLDDMAALLRKD